MHYAAWERDGGTPVLQRTERGASSYAGTIPGCNRNGGGSGNSGNGGNGGGGNDRHDPPVWGWDVDNDGDLDTSNPLDPRVDNPVKPDGDCGGGCYDDGDDNDDSGGGGGCFLTTAVVAMRGEADNGPTLTALREFRDGWLASTPEGRALIAEYYVMAPRIVAAIPEGHVEWSWIADQTDAARNAIRLGHRAEALAIYSRMVRTLQERWLSNRIDGGR